jgi:acetyl-CoA carboxylase biotin carboxyl carrier protein
MDIDAVEEIANVFGASHLTKIEMSGPGWAIEMEREPAAPAVRRQAAPPTPAPAEAAPAAAENQIVTSPGVGVFQETEPRTEAGRRVRAGDIVGYVEALSLRTDIRAVIDGFVSEVLVEDGQPVEYGQPLFAFQESVEDEG